MQLGEIHKMKSYDEMLHVAIEQAKIGLREGGVPIGAALFDKDGKLLGEGRNRRVQNSDPATHAETDAFRNAGRQCDYRDTILVTTLSPCWYCSGLIRQFKIGTVIIGENSTFCGGEETLRELGVKVIVMDNQECKEILNTFIQKYPEIWNEDIGEICSTKD